MEPSNLPAAVAPLLELNVKDFEFLLKCMELAKTSRQTKVENGKADNLIATFRSSTPSLKYRFFVYAVFFAIIGGDIVVLTFKHLSNLRTRLYEMLMVACFLLLVFVSLELVLHIDLLLAKVSRPKALPHLRPAMGNLLHRIAEVVDPGPAPSEKDQAQAPEVLTADRAEQDEVVEDPHATSDKHAFGKQKQTKITKPARADATVRSDSQDYSASAEAKLAASKLDETGTSSVPPPIEEPAIMATGSDTQVGANTKQQKEKVVGLKPNAMKHERQSMNTTGDWVNPDADFFESES